MNTIISGYPKLNESHYLTKLNPSLHACIEIRTDPGEINFRSVLSFCKQWHIRHIIIKVFDINNTNYFSHLHNTLSDSFLFDFSDFDFYLQFENLENAILKKCWKEKVSPDDFLLSWLTHKENFEIQFRSFGKEIYRFFDDTPEIIECKVEKKKLQYELKNTNSIFAIFVCDAKNKNLEEVQQIDLSKYLNIRTGKLLMPWSSSDHVHIFIVRRIFGSVDNKIRQKLNLLSEDIFKLYLRYLDEVELQHSDLFKGWIFDPFKNIPILKKALPFRQEFIEAFSQKKGKEVSNSAIHIWYNQMENSHHQLVDLMNFQRENFQKVLKNSLSSVKNKNIKKYIFQLRENGKDIISDGIPIQLFDFVDKLDEFNLSIISDYIFPNGKYSNEKEIEFRIAASIMHHFNHVKVNVNCGELLCISESFEDKLWYTNWLISCGIINIIQRIEFETTKLKSNLYANLPTSDPLYYAYKKWFEYIQTLANFASKGIHRCDVLILYPNESYFSGNVIPLSEFLPNIANNGIDFDLIDFNNFTNKKVCNIVENKLNINKEKYSILVLPGVDTIPIEVLRKIHEFYSAGGTVISIGKLPTKSTDWDKDHEIESLSNEIWFKKSSISSTKFKTNKWGGKGYFQSDVNLLSDIILENENLLNLKLNTGDCNLRVLVRETPTEFYILLFNLSTDLKFNGTVNSKYKGKPQFWNTINNTIENCYNFKIENSYLKIPITIPVRQSKILILKKQSLKSIPRVQKSDLEQITDLKVKNRKIYLKGLIKNKGNFETEVNIFGTKKIKNIKVSKFEPSLTIGKTNWNIEFNQTKITESIGDLSKQNDTFCGTVSYKKIIVIKKEYIENYKLHLDLGRVKDIIEVFINKNKLGLYFLPPYQIDVTNFLKTGDNKFEFRVSNSLFNKYSSMHNIMNKDDYTKEFGLFGPVKILLFKELEMAI